MQAPGHPTYDLMEGSVWWGLLYYSRYKFDLKRAVEVVNFLDTEFRWIRMRDAQVGSPEDQILGALVTPDEAKKQTFRLTEEILEDRRTVRDVNCYPWRDPVGHHAADCREPRCLWSDHALVVTTV